MAEKSVQDFLLSVEKPSQYLGGEINSVVKDPDQVRLRMLLAFPDRYEIGTSHFGIQILYSILNSRPDIAAERIFAPAPDMERQLRSRELPVTSLETHTPMGAFDMVGFSLLYELNYTNVVTLMELAGIPVLAADRDDRHPVIIAGGPCCCNPEPVADLFDTMVIGDGETVVVQMADLWLKWQAEGDGRRETLLDMWSTLQGVYVPSRYTVFFDDNGRQVLTAAEGAPRRITRALAADLEQAPFPSRPVVPFGRPVHDRLRVELARGCTRGCRFCQAGMIYRPVRERSVESLLALTADSLDHTGYDDLSLLSLSTGDYSRIGELMERLMARCERDYVSVSLPSLRAGTLTPALMKQIRKVRKTGFTLAPEAGSQRLRDVINKNITESDIVEAVDNAFSLGWQLIKLYFMIGLPTETDADLTAIVALVRRLTAIRSAGRRKPRINVSIGTFIPKPHTPFQWAPQLEEEAARGRLNMLKEALRMPGVQVKWQRTDISRIEGMWSRGDRRLTPLLLAAHRRGCRFDGWSDLFRMDLWQAAMAECAITPEHFTGGNEDVDQPLPWDHIDMGVDRTYLISEWHNALNAVVTGDCRHGDCQGCGVCDFHHIEPRIQQSQTQPAPAVTLASADPTAHDTDVKVVVEYTKTAAGRFFGHLELVNIITRGIRRSGIPVRYTQGFHPKPRLSFQDTLPIGMESLCERFHMWIPSDIDMSSLAGRLNRHMPAGIAIRRVSPAGPRKRGEHPDAIRYRVQLSGAVFDPSRLAGFISADTWPVERRGKKGQVHVIDLKPMVVSLKPIGDDGMEMVLTAHRGRMVRPADILQAVMKLPEPVVADARICKEAVVDMDGM